MYTNTLKTNILYVDEDRTFYYSPDGIGRVWLDDDVTDIRAAKAITGLKVVRARASRYDD